MADHSRIVVEEGSDDIHTAAAEESVGRSYCRGPVEREKVDIRSPDREEGRSFAVEDSPVGEEAGHSSAGEGHSFVAAEEDHIGCGTVGLDSKTWCCVCVLCVV